MATPTKQATIAKNVAIAKSAYELANSVYVFALLSGLTPGDALIATNSQVKKITGVDILQGMAIRFDYARKMVATV